MKGTIGKSWGRRLLFSSTLQILLRSMQMARERFRKIPTVIKGGLENPPLPRLDGVSLAMTSVLHNKRILLMKHACPESIHSAASLNLSIFKQLYFMSYTRCTGQVILFKFLRGPESNPRHSLCAVPTSVPGPTDRM